MASVCRVRYLGTWTRSYLRSSAACPSKLSLAKGPGKVTTRRLDNSPATTPNPSQQQQVHKTVPAHDWLNQSDWAISFASSQTHSGETSQLNQLGRQMIDDESLACSSSGSKWATERCCRANAMIIHAIVVMWSRRSHWPNGIGPMRLSQCDWETITIESSLNHHWIIIESSLNHHWIIAEGIIIERRRSARNDDQRETIVCCENHPLTNNPARWY